MLLLAQDLNLLLFSCLHLPAQALGVALEEQLHLLLPALLVNNLTSLLYR
jgi:hypothetical protein